MYDLNHLHDYYGRLSISDVSGHLVLHDVHSSCGRNLDDYRLNAKDSGSCRDSGLGYYHVDSHGLGDPYLYIYIKKINKARLV